MLLAPRADGCSLLARADGCSFVARLHFVPLPSRELPDVHEQRRSSDDDDKLEVSPGIHPRRTAARAFDAQCAAAGKPAARDARDQGAPRMQRRVLFDEPPRLHASFAPFDPVALERRRATSRPPSRTSTPSPSSPAGSSFA
ncbi:hypothetical protein KFE25_000350 [Diacronema lutheri]|uniref:Uncharacterized protein n=2 Tax=Diacronema lutheri TaxID=2081491 RepID=A0A8J6CBZ0_DIALT|nr:hypothetical protein KFE25_000350 [Diacronema lutheri]